jgi:hypothetical protein
MRDKCLVFVPDGADSLLTILKEKFRETTRQEFNVAYEFKYALILDALQVRQDLTVAQ